MIAAHLDEFGRYPMNKGLDAFCRSRRRNGSTGAIALPRPVDPATEVLVLNGTREGLFLAALAAARWVSAAHRHARPMLIPNPFYAAYAAGAIAADCEPVYLPATAATGFLPDLDALGEELLARTVAFYLASPANPQGAVADRAYLARLVALARRFGFLMFADECYSRNLQRARRRPACWKRAGPISPTSSSSTRCRSARTCPGCASASPPATAASSRAYLELRNVAAPQVPMPAQHVAIAAYGDETHVEENRRLYEQKFDLADQIIGDRYGYRRPAGGFFLWLDVSAQGGSEAATLRLWREAGVRVVPGRYLAREQADGSNPGAGLHPRRHGAGQGDHRRGAASPRRGARCMRVRDQVVRRSDIDVR